MTKKYSGCSKRLRGGLTLIEVVAGLALLGALLTTSLLSYTSHVEQIRTARQRLAAIESADSLLMHWFAKGTFPDFPAAGECCDEPFRWQAAVARKVRLPMSEVQIVRLEIFEQADITTADALASVEFVIDDAAEVLQAGAHE